MFVESQPKVVRFGPGLVCESVKESVKVSSSRRCNHQDYSILVCINSVPLHVGFHPSRAPHFVHNRIPSSPSAKTSDTRALRRVVGALLARVIDFVVPQRGR